MRRLLIPVLIAFAFSHLACALSDGVISESNGVLKTLIAGDGTGGVNLPSIDLVAHFDDINGLDEKSKDETGYRIASTELKLDVDSNLYRLGTTEVESDPWNAYPNLGSYSAASFDILLAESEESKDVVSKDDTLIASTYLASNLNLKFDDLYEVESGIEGEKSDFLISGSGLGSDAEANLDWLLSKSGEFEAITYYDLPTVRDHEKSIDSDFKFIENIYTTPYTPADRSQFYKYDESVVPLTIGKPIISQEMSSKDRANLDNLSYKYEKSPYDVNDIDSIPGYIKIDLVKEGPKNNQCFNSDRCFCYLNQLATSSGEIGRVGTYDQPEVNTNLDVLIQTGSSDTEHIVPYLFSGWDAKQEKANREDHQKNHAVVVGINNYEDWSGLKSPVNDAREISEILEACGYEVVELTDETEMRPTKANILSSTLGDIRREEIDGNIIFYFSGHGIRDNDGTFYLVPQDAKSDDLSSCISELELRGYLRDLENLAVIIDACNSGDLNIANEGQVVLTSSKKDEPSNEEWFGSLSVFTYNLCKAIEEQMLSNGNISLSECFYRARNDTIQWSSWRLIRQTPEIIDLTGGSYYIK